MAKNLKDEKFINIITETFISLHPVLAISNHAHLFKKLPKSKDCSSKLKYVIRESVNQLGLFARYFHSSYTRNSVHVNEALNFFKKYLNWETEAELRKIAKARIHWYWKLACLELFNRGIDLKSIIKTYEKEKFHREDLLAIGTRHELKDNLNFIIGKSKASTIVLPHC